MTTGKRWSWVFSVLSITIILMIISVNYYIDSYRVFHKTYSGLFREPNQNFAKMSFLLDHKSKYDSFIFGSSRVGHIRPSGIENGHYYNMTYSEGLPIEHLENLKLMLKNDINIKNVLIGLDEYSYEIDPRMHQNQPMRLLHFETEMNTMSELEFYLYYLFKLPTLFDIKHLFSLMLNDVDKQTYDYDIYTTGLPVVPKEIEDEIENNIQKHVKDSMFTVPTASKGNRVEQSIDTIKETIQLSKVYGFKIIWFFNPLQKTRYLGLDFETMQRFKKELSKITDFYDFSGLNTVTMNNYYYYDTSHYRSMVGEYMKSRIFDNNKTSVPVDFGVFVTKEIVDRHLYNLEIQRNYH